MKGTSLAALALSIELAGPLAFTSCSSASQETRTATKVAGPQEPSETAVADAGGDGKGAIVPCVADESAAVPTDRCTTDASNTSLSQCGTWLKVEIPGTVCGDGSQFKFFVNYSNTSNDVLVSFEPGGACWDYESCSGQGGVRGAANPNGIPDTHMSTYQYLNLLRRTNDNPAQNYNMVFVSYCTGDLHTGNNVATYTSAGPVDGGAGNGEVGQIVYRHSGHANTLAVIDWLHKTFTNVPRLFVTGCSAGGAGAMLNYHFIRQTMGNSVQCAYLLDDSGPIFHSAGPSMQVGETIRAAWNVDSVLQTLDGQLPVSVSDLENDFGLINQTVARKYPHDRLALSAYRMDFNYSLYSYQRFFPGSTEAQIHAMFWEDMQQLMKDFDAEPNLAYYVPYFRTDNCSHCVSIPPIGNPPLEPTDNAKALTQPWLGSDIPRDMIDLKQFVVDLLDDTKPLKSYAQDPQANESFMPQESAQCLDGG